MSSAGARQLPEPSSPCSPSTQRLASAPRVAAIGTLTLALSLGCSASGEASKVVSGSPGSAEGGAANGSGGADARPAQPALEGLGGVAGRQPDSFDGNEACAGESREARRKPIALAVLLDTSSSMASPLAGDGGKSEPSKGDAGTGATRLSASVSALKSFMSSLAGDVALGLSRYPQYPWNTNVDCINGKQLQPVQALGARDSAQRSALDAALADLDTGGATPTYEGLVFAEEELRQFAAAQPDPAIHGQYVLLLTDGYPTDLARACFDDFDPVQAEAMKESRLVQRVTEMRSAGITTFVVGAPGSEAPTEINPNPRGVLSKMAEAGSPVGNCNHDGAPYCHFDLSSSSDFASELASTLASISQSILACDFELPAPPAGEALDRNKVNLRYFAGGSEERLIPFDEACVDGWRYAGERIRICGAACERVQSDASARLELEVGCQTVQRIQ